MVLSNQALGDQKCSASMLFAFRMYNSLLWAVSCRLFSHSPVSYTLDASSSSSPVMTTKDGSKYCALSPGAGDSTKFSPS